MSSGHYGWIYHTIEYDIVGRMYDRELDDLMADLVNVLRDVENWQGGDIGEEEYRKTVNQFKTKWLNSKNRNKNIEKIIKVEVQKLKSELLIHEEE